LKNFAILFRELEETTDENIKFEALINYFNTAAPSDAIWALSLLMGRKISRIVSVKKLQQWSVDLVGTPPWLFVECFNITRNLSETIAMILPYKGNSEILKLQILIEEYLLPLRNQNEESQKEKITSIWQIMDSTNRYIYNKLLIGTFSFDVSPNLVIKAFSSFCGLNPEIITDRLSVDWIPTTDFYAMLISSNVDDSIVCSSFPKTAIMKQNPIRINAVLLYSKMERLSLFSDYTFALWHQGKLVPFARTNIGLSQDEIIKVDTFIRNNTIEKFGPVRSIKPELIFELEFDGLQKSSRHKSGVIPLFPRISGWLHNKNIRDAGTLDHIKSLLDQ
jgi:ATP-dependent DNA ligase